MVVPIAPLPLLISPVVALARRIDHWIVIVDSVVSLEWPPPRKAKRSSTGVDGPTLEFAEEPEVERLVDSGT